MKRKNFGLIKKNKIYKFDDSYLSDKLPNAKISGADTRKGRFILVYKDDEEKKYYESILNIDGKKVIYSIKDFKDYEA